LELRVHPTRLALARFSEWAEIARQARCQLRVELDLAALGLENLCAGADAVAELAAACAARGVTLEVAPLRAGLGDLRFVPTRR
jgi:hypothetical protein